MVPMVMFYYFSCFFDNISNVSWLPYTFRHQTIQTYKLYLNKWRSLKMKGKEFLWTIGTKENIASRTRDMQQLIKIGCRSHWKVQTAIFITLVKAWGLWTLDLAYRKIQLTNKSFQMRKYLSSLFYKFDVKQKLKIAITKDGPTHSGLHSHASSPLFLEFLDPILKPSWTCGEVLIAMGFSITQIIFILSFEQRCTDVVLSACCH